jgi:hypothetical protein
MEGSPAGILEGLKGPAGKFVLYAHLGMLHARLRAVYDNSTSDPDLDPGLLKILT